MWQNKTKTESFVISYLILGVQGVIVWFKKEGRSDLLVRESSLTWLTWLDSWLYPYHGIWTSVHMCPVKPHPFKSNETLRTCNICLSQGSRYRFVGEDLIKWNDTIDAIRNFDLIWYVFEIWDRDSSLTSYKTNPSLDIPLGPLAEWRCIMLRSTTGPDFPYEKNLMTI